MIAFFRGDRARRRGGETITDRTLLPWVSRLTFLIHFFWFDFGVSGSFVSLDLESVSGLLSGADYEEELGCEEMEGNFGGGCGGVGDNGGPSDGRPPNPFAGPDRQCFTVTQRKAALIRHESLVRFQQHSFLLCFLCLCVCYVETMQPLNSLALY